MKFPSLRAIVCALAVVVPTTAPAVVNTPVLKWQQGGCGSFCQTGWYSSPAVKDLDGDGTPEVIWGSYDVVVLNGATGATRARGTNGQRVWPGVAVADLTGDGTQEIVVGRGGNQVTVYRFDGSSTLQTVWTRNPFANNCAGNNCEVRTLAVEDLESDGQLEVIVGRASGGSDQQVNAFTATGSVRPGFPARQPAAEGFGWGMYNENVTVADLNDDGFKEIIAPTDTHYITAVDRNGNGLPTNAIYDHIGNPGTTPWARVGVHVDHAADLQGFANCGTQHRPNFANSAPAIGDLNGDAVREIVVPGDVYNCGVGDPAGDLYHLPFILNVDRTRWSGSGFNWTVLPTPEPGSGPVSQDYNVIENDVQNAVLADLDNNGFLEILIPSYDGRLHVWWLDKTEHGNWPYDVPGSGIRFASEPAVADLDNDGQAEVIFTSWGQKAGNTTGQLHILSSQGVALQAVNLPVVPGEWNGGLAAPTLANIDGDADLEVVVGTSASGAVAYDLPGTANARVLWGTGRGNLQRTGALAAEPPIPPTVSIADASRVEGNSGSAPLSFTLTLSRSSTRTITVAYATSNGTATAGADYTATSGVVTFSPGVVSRTVAVSVLGDAMDEPNETFVVNLSAPTNATLADGQATGAITDDDAAPELLIEDCVVTEGNTGTAPCVVSLSLSMPSGFTVTANYASQGATATSGIDFTPANGVVTFPPNTGTPQTVTVAVLGDVAPEGQETFAVVLSSESNVQLTDNEAAGVIVDDDQPILASNTMLHGASQWGVLGPGADLYRFRQEAYSSFEAVVESVSADALPPVLQRVAADGTTVVDTATSSGPGGAHRLTGENTFPAPFQDQYLRVGSAGCAGGCGADDLYRISFFDTTYSIPRFNNAGSQVTILTVQNNDSSTTDVTAYFWSALGQLLGKATFTVPPRGSVTTNTSLLSFANLRSGSITLTARAPYGALSGKAVSIEGSSGFSFDAILQPRK